MTVTDLREVARHTLPILPVEAQGVIGDGGEGESEDGSVEAGDDAGDDGEEGPRVGENIGIVYEREDEEPTDMRWNRRADSQ